MQLEIDRTANTICGELAVEGAESARFYGWLELIDQLERATNRHGSEPPSAEQGRELSADRRGEDNS